MSKIFVGGLSFSTTEEDLRESFKKFGNISEVRIIMDRNTGRSRGFGFVTFEDKADASEAVSKMNNVELDGRSIHCEFAQEKEDRGSRGPPRSSGPYGRGGGGGYRGGGGYGGGSSYRRDDRRDDRERGDDRRDDRERGGDDRYGRDSERGSSYSSGGGGYYKSGGGGGGKYTDDR